MFVLKSLARFLFLYLYKLREVANKDFLSFQPFKHKWFRVRQWTPGYVSPSTSWPSTSVATTRRFTGESRSSGSPPRICSVNVPRCACTSATSSLQKTIRTRTGRAFFWTVKALLFRGGINGKEDCEDSRNEREETDVDHGQQVLLGWVLLLTHTDRQTVIPGVWMKLMTLMRRSDHGLFERQCEKLGHSEGHVCCCFMNGQQKSLLRGQRKCTLARQLETLTPNFTKIYGNHKMGYSVIQYIDPEVHVLTENHTNTASHAHTCRQVPPFFDQWWMKALCSFWAWTTF